MARRPTPRGGNHTDKTMRQLRYAIRSAIQDSTLSDAARLADCSENTLCRILKGENVSVRTAARICEAMGYRLILELQPISEKTQLIADAN